MVAYNSYVIILLLMIYTIFSIFAINKTLKYSYPALKAASSSLSGPAALILINFISEFTGIYLYLSPINIGISMIAGIPGVCMLIIFNAIFKG